MTGAEVEALSNSVVQGTNPFHKTKVSSIASIFTEFDAKYDGEFANDHATVARVSRESLALIFDLLPPKRSTPLTVEELEDAALEVWMRLETPTQKLAFLWYPHADAPRRYKGRASLPPGKKPTAVWEVADGVREGKRLLLFGTTDKIKKNTDEPVIRIVPVPAIYGLTSSELVEICNAATWSRTEFMAVGSWLRTAIKCGEGDLRINMLRRVQATLLLVELARAPEDSLFGRHMHRRGLLAQANVALGHEVDSHTVFNYMLQCSDVVDTLRAAIGSSGQGVVEHVVSDMTQSLAVQLRQLLRISDAKPEELMTALLQGES